MIRLNSVFRRIGIVALRVASLSLMMTTGIFAQTTKPQAPHDWLGGDEKAIQQQIVEGNQLGLNLQGKLQRSTDAFLGADYRPTVAPVDNSDGVAEVSWIEGIEFVEQVYAMALAQDWPDFLERFNQMQARDEDGNRPELFAEWLPANRWLFWDATGELEVPNKVFEWPVTKQLPGQARPQQDGAQTMTVSIIPRDAVPNAVRHLTTGDLLLGIQQLNQGMKCQAGIGIETERGLMVRFADARIGQVTERPVAEWMDEGDWIGMKAYRLHARAELLARPMQFNLSLPKQK